MIKPIVNMTLSQLENLKVRFQSIVLEQEAEIGRRQARLDTRLERQAVDSAALANLQQNLDKTKQVRDELISAGSPASTIATAQELVDTNQLAVDNNEQSPSFISDEESHILQAELDELELGRQDKVARIAAIDAILSP